MPRFTLIRLSIYGLVLCLQITQTTARERIIVDGLFADWGEHEAAYSDPIGDHGTDSLDLGRLYIANDEQYLLLYLETGAELDLQELNDLRLYIDSDNSALSGWNYGGIGAEMCWRFGERNGAYFIGRTEFPLYRSNLGLVIAPTVRAHAFEIAIRRDALLGERPLFGHDTIALYLEQPDGDRLPNEGDTLRYVFHDSYPPATAIPALRRSAPEHVRLVSYNARQGALFADSLRDVYGRILQALDADILCFQELYDYGAAELGTLLESRMPPGEAYTELHKTEPDIVLASRYPIRAAFAIPGQNAGYVLGLGAGREMLLVTAHLPCCEKDAERQQEADAIMAFLRTMKNPENPDGIAAGSPIVIMGDLNLVGDAQQLRTLLQGDIADEGSYGPDVRPDWNGEPLRDLIPHVTGLPHVFTWHPHPFSSWTPGRLDFVLYSAAVLRAENNYALFTAAMPADSLRAYGLQADDVYRASDHLPLVADFSVTPLTDVEHTQMADIEPEIHLHKVHARHTMLTVCLTAPKALVLELDVFTLNGAHVAHTSIALSAGRQSFSCPMAKRLAEGVYYLRLQGGDATSGSLFAVVSN